MHNHKPIFFHIPEYWFFHQSFLGLQKPETKRRKWSIHSMNNYWAPTMCRVNIGSSVSKYWIYLLLQIYSCWYYVFPTLWRLKYGDTKWNRFFLTFLLGKINVDYSMPVFKFIFAILLLHENQNSYNHWSSSSLSVYVYSSLYLHHLNTWLLIYIYWINGYWMGDCMGG